MASIDLIQTAQDWGDNDTSAVLPSGKWALSGNSLVLTNSEVPTTAVDYGPDRLYTVRNDLASVFLYDPGGLGVSPFMAKTTGHMVLEITATASNASLAGAGVFVLVEGNGYSGSLFIPSVAPFAAGVATRAMECSAGEFGFPAGTSYFVGLGFIPWHIASDQPLAAFLGAAVIWSLSVKAYWTDSFLVAPPFWQNFSVRSFGGQNFYSQREV